MAHASFGLWTDKGSTLKYGDISPQDVFISFVVDHGGNVVKACTALGIYVLCRAHVNTRRLGLRDWSSEETMRKPGDEGVEEAGCVCLCLQLLRNQQRQVEGHPDTSRGVLQDLRELVRCNDTRWTSQHKIMASLLQP